LEAVTGTAGLLIPEIRSGPPRRIRAVMVRRARAVAALLPLVLGAAAGAAGHDFWVEPSSFRPALGSSVSLGLRVGEGFRGEPFPRIPDYIVRFVSRDGRGERPVPGRPGHDPAGQLQITEPGLSLVLYESLPYPTEVAAEKFEQYLASEGLDAIAALRRKRGETGRPAMERFSRCAKAMLVAEAPATRKAWADEPLGCPLELLAETDPMTTPPDSDLVFRVLFRGRPLAGVRVAAREREQPEAVVSARSDSDGRVHLRLRRAGVWLVKALHVEPAPADAAVSWESWWASLTFESSTR
jgi:uncharacterized GH25 family protein